MRIITQNQITIADERRLFRRLILAAAAEGQFDPSEQNRETPRFLHKIDRSVEKIGAVIGPGGKMIKSIEAETGADVSIEQDGTIFIAAVDAAGGERAAEIIRSITQEIEIGAKYKGKVTRLMGMGAFVVHTSKGEQLRPV